jgi:tRNA pseudouridine55 synthase
MKDGIMVINKPKGMTSHDVVDCVRRKLKMRRVGHAGTLDPAATGVLVVLLGRCTKLFDSFLNFDKEYLATLKLGARTSSADAEGTIVETKDYSHVTEAQVAEVFLRYTGTIMQTPPMVSAVKHNGRRLYKLAFQGKTVERTPRKVQIKELKVLEYHLPEIKFYMKCSRGTYVRQLGEDIAAELGCAGHVSQIERLSIGPYHLKTALSLDEINEDRILPCFGLPLEVSAS